MRSKDRPAAALPAAANPDPDDLLNEHEGAAYLGNRAVQTLRNWRAKGIGPRFVKIGARMVRYRRRDLEAFINGEAAQ